MRQVLLLIILLWAGSLALAQELVLCKVLLQWSPQAQFAGFYMAKHEGIYQEEGLEVMLSHSDLTTEPIEALINQEVDFTTAFLTTALRDCQRGSDIVLVCQITQTSSQLIVARKEAGINSPQDLSGRKVGIWASQNLGIPFLAFLRVNNIVQHEIVTVLSTVDLFLYKAVDAISCMYFDEYYQLRQSGIDDEELTCLRLIDSFPDFVDMGLYCTSATYKKSPDIARKLREATLKGWRLAFEDKDYTLRIIQEACKEHHAPFNKMQQLWMLNEMEKIIFPNGQDNDGALKQSSLEQAYQILQIDKPRLDLRQFAPLQFKDKPNNE